ncbi:MAG: glycogen debranching enzyme, partial [Chlamydiae bacterium]|nr:glycogen debranching enzyme [Chlamydiota bacterium]
MQRQSSGTPLPLGCSKEKNTYNFAIFSEHAEEVTIGLFVPNSRQPLEQYPLNKTGSIWHIALSGLDESFTYAFRAKGPHQMGSLYNGDVWLADPYAKEIDSPAKWNARDLQASYPAVRAFLPKNLAFDWQGVEAPQIPRSELIIYEAHVRGLTKHTSSKTAYPGTYLAFIEKIPHLKKLGINAIELMPMFEFEETHSKNIDPETCQPLPNYWGYNSLHFFAPMRRYAKA